jgi:glycosyltransferase involved in cell wall biosynthesis
MSDAIDVVIPARNEADNIGWLISALKLHPAIGRVVVIVDADTHDDTYKIACAATDNGDVVCAGRTPRGKGQCVTYGLGYTRSPYILFCDADIKGLTYDHISLLLCDAIAGNRTMTIGVPDVAKNLPSERIWAWRWVSGQRCMPASLVPTPLIGYLMETQINRAARDARLQLRFEWLRGLKSPYNITEQRITEMQRDAEIGRKLGILLCHP